MFPLSNPTENSEATPEEIYRWTDGRALVATGSPFPDVVHRGASYPVGQGNNAFIFPGLGLGALLSRSSRVTEGMLTAAAVALSQYTDDARIARGGLFPRIEMLRSVSRQVAVAVMRQAAAEGVAGTDLEDDLEGFVDREMWRARYLPLRPRA